MISYPWNYPVGNVLASGSLDKKIKLWDLRMNSCVATLAKHKKYVLSLAFSPDGQWLVSGSKDRNVLFWDPRSYAMHLTLQGHKNSGLLTTQRPRKWEAVASKPTLCGYTTHIHIYIYTHTRTHTHTHTHAHAHIMEADTSYPKLCVHTHVHPWRQLHRTPNFVFPYVNNIWWSISRLCVEYLVGTL